LMQEERKQCRPTNVLLEVVEQKLAPSGSSRSYKQAVT
jgi:hypothetical protein